MKRGPDLSSFNRLQARNIAFVVMVALGACVGLLFWLAFSLKALLRH